MFPCKTSTSPHTALNYTMTIQDGMHPVIRIVNLVLLGIIMSFSSFSVLLVAGGIVFFLYLLTPQYHLKSMWKLLRRLRWIFLSMSIIYFWFTPGDPLILFSGLLALSQWMPTVEGVVLGLLHITGLVILIASVNLLLQTTSREQLLSAILWLTHPLNMVGISHERFAVRMTLVLETVTKMQALYDKPQDKSERKNGIKNPLQRISTAVIGLYQKAHLQAELASLHAIEVPEPASPPMYQWLYPIGFCSVLLIAYVIW